MLDFLKAIVDRLRMDLLLASLALAILLLKLCGFDTWWMVFAFCVSYIVMLGVEKWLNNNRKKKDLRKQAIAMATRVKQKEDNMNEEVWKRFYALDPGNLELLKTIYLADMDPGNSLIRYIHDGGALAYEIDRSYDFRIPGKDRVYYPLLYSEHLASASVITFHPYYLKLVARYVETGRKERV